ncbi:MAG: hypothetical protein AAF203_07410 [Pseudomonadota bacterium]
MKYLMLSVFAMTQMAFADTDFAPKTESFSGVVQDYDGDETNNGPCSVSIVANPSTGTTTVKYSGSKVVPETQEFTLEKVVEDSTMDWPTGKTYKGKTFYSNSTYKSQYYLRVYYWNFLSSDPTGATDGTFKVANVSIVYPNPELDTDEDASPWLTESLCSAPIDLHIPAIK